MPVFYRGAGVGTFWHQRDARISGFQAWNPGAAPSPYSVIRHIVTGTVASPFISLTRSFGVARTYALAGARESTEECPGYVYEIEIDGSAEFVNLIDPLQRIAGSLPDPIESHSYHHDGSPDFILGIVSPDRFVDVLRAPYPQPPPEGGTVRPPKLSAELEAMVRVLRDAEVLAVRSIPAICIRGRFKVW